MVIEDALHHIEDYVRYTDIPVIIFDMPWNRGYREDRKRVFRTKHWQEIENHILTLKFIPSQ